jgi:hypothetical protein
MEKFVKAPVSVSFTALHLDPNNPRLGREEYPGYEDVKVFTDKKTQLELEKALAAVYEVDDLAQSIVGQGWMPVDNIVVWQHPGSNCYVVVEGNRRTVALRLIRGPMLERESKKLERMEKGRGFAPHDVEAQRELVRRIKQVIADTDNLTVVPLAADTVEELEHKLPRVLAVRHITGARQWGNFSEDLWLMRRYQQLFEDSFPGEAIRWEDELIKQVAAEASLQPSLARRQLQATSAYSHFRAQYEGDLPEAEEFATSDYYLFENIAKRPWLRNQFGLGTNSLHLSEDGEKAIFEWVFKLTRGHTADDNPNIFYRHENVILWDQIHKYDDKTGTSFADRFDVSEPTTAPTMREVEADFVGHKARRKPQALLDELLRRLGDIPAEAIINEGEFLRAQLKRLKDQSTKLLKLVEAAAGN